MWASIHTEYNTTYCQNYPKHSCRYWIPYLCPPMRLYLFLLNVLLSPLKKSGENPGTSPDWIIICPENVSKQSSDFMNKTKSFVTSTNCPCLHLISNNACLLATTSFPVIFLQPSPDIKVYSWTFPNSPNLGAALSFNNEIGPWLEFSKLLPLKTIWLP